MKLELILPPSLNFSSEAFIEAWNDSLDCSLLGKAEIKEYSSTQFDPGIGVGILLGIVSGVASNMIYDAIKKTLASKDVKQQIHIEHIQQSDGTNTLIVKIHEKDA